MWRANSNSHSTACCTSWRKVLRVLADGASITLPQDLTPVEKIARNGVDNSIFTFGRDGTISLLTYDVKSKNDGKTGAIDGECKITVKQYTTSELTHSFCFGNVAASPNTAYFVAKPRPNEVTKGSPRTFEASAGSVWQADFSGQSAVIKKLSEPGEAGPGRVVRITVDEKQQTLFALDDSFRVWHFDRTWHLLNS